MTDTVDKPEISQGGEPSREASESERAARYLTPDGKPISQSRKGWRELKAGGRKTTKSLGHQRDTETKARLPHWHGVSHELPRCHGSKNQWGLTPKQEMFAQCLAKGMTQADAYRSAYDTSRMKSKTVWQNGSYLAAKEKVRLRADMIIADNKRSALHDAAKVREFVLRGLHREATQGDSSAARIRAMELLGKLDVVGMFQDRKEVVTKQQRPAEEVMAELEAKLRSLGLTARDVTPSGLEAITRSSDGPQIDADAVQVGDDAEQGGGG
jgi:hypothetical protein